MRWISASLRESPTSRPNTDSVPIAFEVKRRFRVDVVSNGPGAD